MSRFASLLIYLLLAAGSVFSQTPRSVARSSSFTAYRSMGEYRLWTFISRDSVVGTLVSTVSENTDMGGTPGIVINEKLSYDYHKIGSALSIELQSKHVVSPQGYYLGDDMNLTVNDQTSRVFLNREGSEISGYFTRGSEKIPQSVPFPQTGFAWDANLVDQLELFLAMRDLKVGDTITDSILEPQAMIISPVRMIVERFGNIRLYNQVFDSAFVIHVVEPQESRAYFTPDKRLAKVEIPGTSTKIYLDAVRKASASSVAKPSAAITLGRILQAIPSFIIYLIFAALSVFLFVAKGFKKHSAYLAFAAGCVLFWTIPFIQVPVQQLLMKSVVFPEVTGGGSIFVWSILPSLLTAVMQVVVLLFGLIGVAWWRSAKTSDLAVIGAFCGAGFGLLEGSYVSLISSAAPVASLALLERAFMILFHATAGVLIGVAYMRGLRSAMAAAGLMIMANFVFRYSPIFVQQKIVSVQVMYFVFAFVCLGLAALALSVLHRAARLLRQHRL
jgi:hypothetical protein